MFSEDRLRRRRRNLAPPLQAAAAVLDFNILLTPPEGSPPNRPKRRGAIAMLARGGPEGFRFTWFSMARAIFWLVATVNGSFAMSFVILMLLGAPLGGHAIVHLGIAMLFLWAREETPK